MSSKKPVVFLAGLFLIALILLSSIPQASAQSSTLFINEILVGNASTNLDTDYYNYSSWIEIYNAGASAVDLKNYSLSYLDFEAPAPVVWKIPVTVSVPANGYVLLWVDEQNSTNHASFEMDMRGQEISLLNPSDVVLDSVTYDMRIGSVLLPDISFGRQTDGSGTLTYFDQPTPGASNTTTGFVSPSLAAAPTFSPPGGFYAGNQSVTLSTSETGAEIRFTTDGSIPTPLSSLYTAPISVTGSTIVRARTFSSDKLDSLTASHTYLINVDTDLPVVSLGTAPAHLFDNTIGIYVAGTNGITGNCMSQPVNWNQKWERPASIEMFEIDGSRVVAQDVGIEIFGSCSRKRPLKSLEIKARRIYGDNDIDYQVLPDKPIDEYKRLILRNSGQDNGGTLFRDAFQQYLVKDMMDIDYQAYRPAVVFLNGTYWGILNIRDKADESFPEQNYDLDADTDFDMFNGTGLEAGNKLAWNTLHNFISSNDLTIQANYDYVKSQVDLEEYMNYFIIEIHAHNKDWLNNNIRYWRAYDNGRWRWILHDLDMAYNNPSTDYLSYVLTQGNAAKLYQSLLFRKLMENTEFRNEFVQRFASHLNISFDPVRVDALTDWFRAGIASEMPDHIARWGAPASITDWDSEINKLRSFSNSRPGFMRSHLNSYLGSPGTANLTINIDGGGSVLAAGVKVPGSGYSGPYFKTIPVTLEAVPMQGWAFIRWEETGDTNPILSETLTGALTRTAVFEEVDIPMLVLNEIHYNPADAQGDDTVYEFVELYNAGTTPVALDGFSLSDGISFTFPASTSIAAGEYIVVANTAATYAGNGYQVFQWSDGNLSNGGETLDLNDQFGDIVDSVTYDDDGGLGWPTSPDGSGPSLSLISPLLDNNLPGNWTASLEIGGSPGTENTFTPQEPASLTAVKQVVGDIPAEDWEYTGGLGTFTLPAAGGQQIFSDLPPGSYEVIESAVNGYTANVSCSNGAAGGNSVIVNLAAGANVICTFVNTAVPVIPASLTIIKQVVGDIPAEDWEFTGGLGTFNLPAAGGQQLFSDLAPGSYEISETAVSGYAAAVSCSNGASGSSSVTVNLGEGDAVTCTFVNTKIDEGCNPPVPGNLILNPDFEEQEANWSFFTNGSASFSIATADPFECTSYAQISVTTSGSNVQLYQENFTLLPNTTYVLQMAGRSSNGQDAQLIINRNSAPNTNYGLRGHKINLTPEWQVFQVEFTTTGFTTPTNDTRLRIWLAPYDTAGTVFEFDGIVLVQN
jgi:hypothetical protein